MAPLPHESTLGIDLGTSHTTAVVRRADGSIRPLLFDGAPLTPSAVCLGQDGNLMVGRDAVHAGRRYPERFEPNPKRLIDRGSTLLGEKEFRITDLIAAALRSVADECRRVVGRTEHGFETIALDGRNDLGGLDIESASGPGGSSSPSS